MIGKNNQYLKNKKEGTKVETYSIKKFKVGTASVVIGASIFFGAGAVAQASEEVSNNTTSDNTTNPNASEGVAAAPVAVSQPVAKETTKEDVAAAVAAKLGGETAQEVKALDKTKLENYIAEIEAKLVNGTYVNKTEESVALLEEELKAAKATLANATTQDEIKKAYSKLVTTANTKLKNKPVEKKETPAVDTTNGKETVGKKAENTEKKSDSNSIENTGSNDPRNNQRIPAGIQFRAEIAYAEDVEKSPYDNKDSYITSGVEGSSESTTAGNATSRIMNYKTRFNTDNTGKITSVDWQVFYNDHLENLDLSYGMRGEVYRNYIQIPKEVNMPTEIKRLKYTAERKLSGGKLGYTFAPKDEYMSKYVTFDNPEPGYVSTVKLQGNDTFAADRWPSISRGYDTLHNNTDFYFKDAASRVPETKAMVDANALEGNRVIWDQSNTGGNLRDGYVWEFTTTVPDATTNEQLKDMKAVMGMLRVGTAGVDHGVHTIAANPVNISKADVTPPKANDLPQGTTVAYKEAVDTKTPGEKQATVVVTYPDTSTKEVPVKVIVEKEVVVEPVVNTNAKARNTVLSTDEKLSGTGTPGATVKVTVRNPEKTEVLLEKTATVNAEGKWEIPLEKGLNSNEALVGASTAARTFYAPKNIVEVIQTVNGIDSEKTDVVVSIGPSAILPSAAAKDGKSVVAGAKEVTFTVPHDAGFTYFFYTNKETNKEVQLDIKREADGSLVMAGGNASKATVKNTVKGPFYDTVTLTLKKG